MMASETRVRPRTIVPGRSWPPHDTEESVLGTNLHQTTITNLRWGINEVASLRRVPGQLVPWEAQSQTALLGCQRPNDSLYRTYPDVFVYPRPIDPRRGSLTVAVDGPPLLIVEVLSDATYDVDIDLAEGKGYSYARAGVREYLALDPASEFMPEGIRAWRRLEDGAYHPWLPEADGRWHSAQIDIAIALEGVMAAVYTRDGRRILREGEGEVERARLRAEIARREEELARKDADVERLQQLLDLHQGPNGG